MKSKSISLVLFALFSMGAIVCGVIAGYFADVPHSILIKNIGAWVVGALISFIILRFLKSPNQGLIIVTSIFLILTCFFSNGIDGVHRWLRIGVVNLNIAQLIMPVSIISLAYFTSRFHLYFIIASVYSVLLCLQPDMSQICAFTFATVAHVFASKFSMIQRLFAILVPLTGTIYTISYPDNLQPVPEVEGIISLATNVSPWLSAFGIISIIICAICPILMIKSNDQEQKAAVIGLVVYSLIVAIVPLFAAFPVPLMGIGVSSILGSWIAICIMMRF